MNEDYSILVNTCDKFDDCWNPFFKLWSIYWPDYKGKIYLNTEYKDYCYEGLNIISLKVCEKHKVPHNKRATWSQCLKWALENIDSDIVLYMQEDYFLKGTVKNEIVEKYVQLMQEHDDIQCIHLTDQAVREAEPSGYSCLNVVKSDAWRLSCQAALWRKKELLDLIRESESAWEFEEFGNKRSIVMNHNYLVVSQKFVKLNRYEIIPYIFTGIVQGRWYEETVPLFAAHDIKMNFTKRGFVTDAHLKPFIKRLNYRLNRIPKKYRFLFDLLKLKKNRNLTTFEILKIWIKKY
jgi:hypothetical protein